MLCYNRETSLLSDKTHTTHLATILQPRTLELKMAHK